MDLPQARSNLGKVQPRSLQEELFVRAYNTEVKTKWGRSDFFDSRWSYQRGFRYNFKKTHPVLYLAADKLVASTEIGPRTRHELLVPHLQSAADPYLYVTVKVTADVLDLTDRRTRSLLGGLTLKELLIPRKQWDDSMKKGIWSVTHHVGKLALEDDRFDGILYPAQPADQLLKIRKQNVAVFMYPSVPTMSRPLHGSVELEVVDAGGVLKRLGLKL